MHRANIMPCHSYSFTVKFTVYAALLRISFISYDLFCNQVQWHASIWILYSSRPHSVLQCSCFFRHHRRTFSVQLCPVAFQTTRIHSLSIFRIWCHTHSTRVLNTCILIALITPCKMFNAFSVFFSTYIADSVVMRPYFTLLKVMSSYLWKCIPLIGITSWTA